MDNQNQVEQLEINGAANINLFKHIDNRGEFTRIFREIDSIQKLFAFEKVRNVYLSKNYLKATLRGFHRQKDNYQEAKFLTCISGKALHVLVRILKGKIQISKNLLLSDQGNATFVPRDCFSAFLTLENNTKLLYLTDKNYSPPSSEGMRWNDPLLNDFHWPISPNIISNQDNNYPDFII